LRSSPRSNPPPPRSSTFPGAGGYPQIISRTEVSLLTETLSQQGPSDGAASAPKLKIKLGVSGGAGVGRVHRFSRVQDVPFPNREARVAVTIKLLVPPGRSPPRGEPALRAVGAGSKRRAKQEDEDDAWDSGAGDYVPEDEDEDEDEDSQDADSDMDEDEDEDEVEDEDAAAPRGSAARAGGPGQWRGRRGAPDVALTALPVTQPSTPKPGAFRCTYSTHRTLASRWCAL